MKKLYPQNKESKQGTRLPPQKVKQVKVAKGLKGELRDLVHDYLHLEMLEFTTVYKHARGPAKFQKILG
jgi:hypothetical protein